MQEKWVGITQKRQQVYLGEKDREAIAATRKTATHVGENLGLFPVIKLTSVRKSTMDQELANCNNVYNIATYSRRHVCVTIKKYNFNKLP